MSVTTVAGLQYEQRAQTKGDYGIELLEKRWDTTLGRTKLAQRKQKGPVIAAP